MTSNGHAPGSRVISIYDYPEHLNPFYEDDNHNKLRFWTIGKKKARSNSFSLSGIRNAMTLRSFRGKKELKTSSQSQQRQSEEVTLRSRPGNLSRSTQSVPCADESVGPRYVYSGSVTPTPLPRFQHEEENRSSRLSINSSNDQSGKPPRPYRKKRRAPPPPTNVIINNVPDISLDDESLKTELKIVEHPTDGKPIENVDNSKTSEEENKLETKDTGELKIAEENHVTEESNTNETVSKDEENISEENPSVVVETSSDHKENTVSLHISESSEIIVNDTTDQKMENTSETISTESKIVDETELKLSSEIENEKIVSSTPTKEKIVTSENEGLIPPIPKIRTILSPGSPAKNEMLVNEIDDSKESEKITENGETVNNSKAIEELDKCTKEINEILKELDNSPAIDLDAPNDDRNNNQMPAWSSFYRSVSSTVPNGKHRAEISNVQLNSSPANSLTDLKTSTSMN